MLGYAKIHQRLLVLFRCNYRQILLKDHIRADKSHTIVAVWVGTLTPTTRESSERIDK